MTADSGLRTCLPADPRGPTVEDVVELAQTELDAWADALHDGAVQSLVVARYAADAAVRGGDPVLVRDAVQVALVALRRTLWHLRPRGGQGLAAALEALSERLVEAGGSSLSLTYDPTAELTNAAAMTAYRLVQAVTQPLVGAERVRVTVRRQGERVLVDIDGGTLSLGVEPWARRALAVGGDLSAGAGRLRLSLPAARDLPAHDLPANEPKATP